MAKMYGFTGLLSGKMGNAVFRARGGEQIVTQYNPIVTNPNTEAQQGGRARFKLVAQLAVVFANVLKGFGTMSITKQSARSGRNPRKGVNAAFVGINYKLTELDPDPTAAEKAVIPLEKVQLTSSNRPYGTITVGEAEEQGKKVVSVSITAPQMANGDKAKVVLVGYGTMSVAKSPYVIGTYDATFEDGVASLITDPVEDGASYTVLSFGVALDHAAVSRLALANMQSEDDFVAEVGISSLIASGAGVATQTIGGNVTISPGA